MEWINRKQALGEPNPKLGSILVIGKNCGRMHVAFYDENSWNHVEDCNEDGFHFVGDDIRFDYWMPLPEPPNPQDATQSNE